VNEHISGGGPQTNQYPNAFNDHLAPNFLSRGVTQNTQTFTIAPGNHPNNGTQVPIQLADGQLYMTLGIYMKYSGGPYPTVFVNGQPAPTTASPGHKCASDNM
jgi:hypothetical protein